MVSMDQLRDSTPGHAKDDWIIVYRLESIFVNLLLWELWGGGLEQPEYPFDRYEFDTAQPSF
ncbi:MAG: hypothetical protein Ct9H300mP28_34140 [Pseudomonadota bacterium]|nr:MAG: hypothetical protein Ct9H300mP28_34140 [Pseudomonadota bacterium]